MLQQDPGALEYRGINPTRELRLAGTNGKSVMPHSDEVHKDSPRPDTPSDAAVDMRERSMLPEDLMGGTLQMQRQSHVWMPREPDETDHNYRVRVSRSTLFPFYEDTICDMASRPFGKEVWFETKPTDHFEAFLKDIDGTGKSVTVFARDLLMQAMHRGMAYILVDADANSGANLKTSLNRRVYAKQIDPLMVLEVRDDADKEGNKHVTYVRYIKIEESVDNFVISKEPTVIELEREIGDNIGAMRVWRFDDKEKKWWLDDSSGGPYNPGEKGIPLFALYGNQIGAWHGRPVLEQLAWINFAHYTSRSDHAHVMRVARLVTLVLTGWKKSGPGNAMDKGYKTTTLGPLSKLESGNPDARASFLEPSGVSMELSLKDLENLSDEAKRLGARHLTSKTGNVTARSVNMDDKKTVNNLQTFCIRLEDILSQILSAFASWRKTTVPSGLVPVVNKEFTTEDDVQSGAQAVAVSSPHLSKKNILRELKRFGLVSPVLDVDENITDLKHEQKEEKALAMESMGSPDDGEDDFGAGVDTKTKEPKSKDQDKDGILDK